jgi:hypothetical protein
VKNGRTTTMVAFMALIFPSTLMASARFPGQVQSALGLSYQPACSLCHVKGNTGPGTAETPFALSMKARGLQAGGRSSVASALTLLEGDRVDSDGDGITDVDELRKGADPNSPDPTTLAGRADPSYGCGGGSSQGRNEVSGPFPAMLAALAIWARRRPRR